MFLLSVVVVLLALLGLGLVVSRLAAPARRFGVARADAAADIGDRMGMLTARLAALKVRLQQRRA